MRAIRNLAIALLSAVFLSTAFGASNTVLGKTSNIYDSITGKWIGVIDGNGNEQVFGSSSGAINGAINVASVQGAVGDCVNDDAPAFTTAATLAAASHATLVIPRPKPGGCWMLKQTVFWGSPTQTIPPALDISAKGLAYNDIQWGGGSGTAGNSKVIFSYHIKQSSVEGIKVFLEQTHVHDVVVWDIDTTASNGTVGQTTFNNMQVALGDGVNNEGFRLGYRSLGGGDVSFITWINSYVYGIGEPTGSQGWTIAGSNTFVLNLVDVGSAFLAVGWTTVGETGAAVGSGGGSFHCWGCGATGNTLDFQFYTTASYMIKGGRFESGHRFLDVNNSAPNVSVEGVEIDSYNNGSNAIFNIGAVGSFNFDNNSILGCTPGNSAMFQFNQTFAVGLALFHGGRIQSTDPFYNVPNNGALWNITLDNVAAFSGGVITGFFKTVQTDTSASPGAATHPSTKQGRAAIALGASSAVITNALVTASSQIVLTLESADTTLKSIVAIPAAGSFTVTGNANATAAAKFSYSIL